MIYNTKKSITLVTYLKYICLEKKKENILDRKRLIY